MGSFVAWRGEGLGETKDQQKAAKPAPSDLRQQQPPVATTGVCNSETSSVSVRAGRGGDVSLMPACMPPRRLGWLPPRKLATATKKWRLVLCCRGWGCRAPVSHPPNEEHHPEQICKQRKRYGQRRPCKPPTSCGHWRTVVVQRGHHDLYKIPYTETG